MIEKVAGKEDKLIYLIPELCFLFGLDDRLRQNPNTMAKLAKHTKAAGSPMQRERALQRYIELVNSKLRVHLLLLS